MFRTLIAVFAVLLLGVTAAAAQSCPEFIQKRQALMKKSGEAAKIGTEMVKGEKVQIYRWRRCKASRTKTGHRQKYTRVKVTKIVA